MSKYLEARKKALKNIQVADHILTQTYPLVKDPKLLLAVVDNIFLALSEIINMAVYYEREEKNIPPFHDSFEIKFDIFKMNLAPKYGINPASIAFIADMKTIIEQHKNSPVEFSRKDSFIICDEEYSMTTITTSQMKKFIDNTREIFTLVDEQLQ
jgi:hypothetical protein